MIYVILILSFGLLNFLRGRGYLGRVVCALTMGAVVSASVYFISNYTAMHSLILFGIVSVFMFLGLLSGWGKYFAVITGDMNTVTESEVKPIDWIVNKLYGYPENKKELITWSFIAMSLRGGMFYPLFAALSYYELPALLYGVGVFSMGTVYAVMRFVPERYSITIAEPLYGAVIGGLISLSV